MSAEAQRERFGYLATTFYDLFCAAPISCKINGKDGRTAFFSRDAQIAQAKVLLSQLYTAGAADARAEENERLRLAEKRLLDEDVVWDGSQYSFMPGAYDRARQGKGANAMTRNDNLSATDRAALYQARELKRRTKVLRQVWMRLAALLLTSSPRRFKQLLEEAQLLANKECRRIYELDHPPRKATRRPR